MLIRKICFFLIVLFFTGDIFAQLIPFGFFVRYPTVHFPTGTTTITSANYKDYLKKNWDIPASATISIDYDQQLEIGSLTMGASANIIHPTCVTDPCAKINLKIDGDAIIPAGASIDTYGAGYLGGISSPNTDWEGRTTGNTTTGGAGEKAGGSHAGFGGNASTYAPNLTYDDFTQPYDYGAGGGSNGWDRTGGDGGGVIRLDIKGDLYLDGAISSDGFDGQSSGGIGAGGGAGGSIWISCKKFSSSSAGEVLSATGGSSVGSGAAGGGGGMIAVYYDSLQGTMAFDAAHVNINGGIGNLGGSAGGTGILFTKKTTDTYPNIYFDNASNLTDYAPTPFPQPINRTYDSINLRNEAKVKQLSTLTNITASTTNIGTDSVLQVPTNSAANYGVWFVPGTINLTGSPAGQLLEY